MVLGDPLCAEAPIPCFWMWGLLTVHSESLSVYWPWKKPPHSPPGVAVCTQRLVPWGYEDPRLVLWFGTAVRPISFPELPIGSARSLLQIRYAQILPVPILLPSLPSKPPTSRSLSQSLFSGAPILRQGNCTITWEAHYKSQFILTETVLFSTSYWRWNKNKGLVLELYTLSSQAAKLGRAGQLSWILSI